MVVEYVPDYRWIDNPLIRMLQGNDLFNERLEVQETHRASCLCYLYVRGRTSKSEAQL